MAELVIVISFFFFGITTSIVKVTHEANGHLFTSYLRGHFAKDSGHSVLQVPYRMVGNHMLPTIWFIPTSERESIFKECLSWRFLTHLKCNSYALNKFITDAFYFIIFRYINSIKRPFWLKGFLISWICSEHTQETEPAKYLLLHHARLGTSHNHW